MIPHPLRQGLVRGWRGKGHASSDEQATDGWQTWQAWLKHVAVTSKVKTVAKVSVIQPNRQKFVFNLQINAEKKKRKMGADLVNSEFNARHFPTQDDKRNDDAL